MCVASVRFSNVKVSMKFKVFFFTSIVILSVFLVFPAAVVAQQPGEAVESGEAISDEQVQLNEEAVQAIFDENYARAISLLRESLLMGELNVTYLNLGRAYQKAGKCGQARQAYDKALEAPAVQQPSPKIVAAQTERYLEELDETCGDKEEAPASPTDEAAANDGKTDETQQSADGPAGGDVSADVQTDGGSQVMAWTATIAGVALVGGGVGMHFLAESERSDLREPQTNGSGVVTGMNQREFEEREQTANTYDTIGLSAGIIGGLTALTGVYLLVTSEGAEQPATADLWVGDGGAGITWTKRF